MAPEATTLPSKDQLIDTSYGINDYRGNLEYSTAEAMKITSNVTDSKVLIQSLII